MLGIFSITTKSQETKRSLGESHSASIQFTDTIGNVTHTLSGEDASLLEKLAYDDFSLLDSDTADGLKGNTIAIYEGNYLDKINGLLNFGTRWYDLLVGRFTTPDDHLDIESLVRTDGLDRYFFENNNPINHVDPTGHWSWSSVLGVVESVVLIVGVIALTVATAGAAAPLASAGVGALLGGGVAGLTYSVAHKDEENVGKLCAAIGGGTVTLAYPATFLAASTRVAAKAAIGGTVSVLTKAAERGVEDVFYGTHYNLLEGATQRFLTGAAVGAIVGVWGEKTRSVTNATHDKLPGINRFEGSFKLRNFTGVWKILEPQPINPWTGLAKEMIKTGTKITGLKVGPKIAKIGCQRS
ncbi:hypothetical protein MMC17_004326 [Xylographa soralifera]|nr:hypothetical protein [Xylographa soralifera]